MVRRIILSATAFSAAMILGACGSKVPSIDQVKSDFNNPSGSTADQTQVIQVTERKDASDGALSVAGGGVVGLGLTVDAPIRGLEFIQPMRMFGPHISYIKNSLLGNQLLALSDASAMSSCVPSNAAASYSGGNSININWSVGDLSSCTEGKLTGSMKVEGKAEINNDKTAFKYDVKLKYTNVCETDGAKACVDGDFVMEANVSLTQAMGTGGTSEEFYEAWFLTTSFNNAAGTRITAETKGGARLNFSTGNTGSSGSYEYLFYAKDNQKHEVTFVLSASADSMGNASIKIKGKDGELTCTESMGAGMCTATGGGAMLSWTADDSAAVSAKLNTDYKLD